jgi:hypothetical protein
MSGEKPSLPSGVFLHELRWRISHLGKVMNMVTEEVAEAEELPDLLDSGWWGEGVFRTSCSL